VKPSVEPEHGGRVELRRNLAAGAEPVVFDAIWSTHEGTWRGQVTIAGGQVSLDVTSSEHGAHSAPPSWLTEWTLGLVRTTLRSVARDPSAALPRRFTRWRAAPEER
jgi:hypothetical protein